MLIYHRRATFICEYFEIVVLPDLCPRYYVTYSSLTAQDFVLTTQAKHAGLDPLYHYSGVFQEHYLSEVAPRFEAK